MGRLLSKIRHAVWDSKNDDNNDTAAQERIRSRQSQVASAITDNMTREGVELIKKGDVRTGVKTIETATKIKKGELTLLRALGFYKDNGNAPR